jgi:aryl-alcohol dehydrogenase-like predicted oxidoreductase
MEALHDLVKSGKVRYIGASSMWGTQFAQLQFVAEKNGWTKFISMQNHYSLLYREEEREMNRFCNDTGVGLIPVCLAFLVFILEVRETDRMYSGPLSLVAILRAP